MATKRSVGTLKEADLKGKSVFVRVDLNVPLDDNSNITDDTRIRAAVPTIKYLMRNGSRVVLCSHLLLANQLLYPKDSIGEEVQKLVAGLPEGGVLLLENVRFYKEEEKNDPESTLNFKHKDDSAATEKFQEINEAYNVLMDPATRFEYDLTGIYEIHKYTLRV